MLGEAEEAETAKREVPCLGLNPVAPAPEEPPTEPSAEPSAEPSERNAQEYDVPEDGGTTGSTHPAQETTTPTQVER